MNHNKLIKQAADRFLGWKIPAGFNPDCGISFKKQHDFIHPEFGAQIYNPIGTNLFSLDEARQMFEYCLDLPDDTAEPSAYITIDALNTLKTNSSASVRVWAKADEEQIDIPLYTHPPKDDAEELIMRIDAESKWAGYGGSLYDLLADLRTHIAGGK